MHVALDYGKTRVTAFSLFRFFAWKKNLVSSAGLKDLSVEIYYLSPSTLIKCNRRSQQRLSFD